MEQVREPDKIERLGYIFVAVLTAATIVSFVHRYLPAVLVDAIRKDVAITDVQFATLQSAFAFTYAGATLMGGYIADRINRRNLIAAGIALWTFGTFVFAFGDSLQVLLAARVMIALGEAVLAPAGLSLLCDFVPSHKRGRAIAVIYFGVTLGTAFAFSGGGAMLDLAEAGAFHAVPGFGAMAGWREVMLLLGGLGLLLIPMVLAFKEPARPFDLRAVDKDRFADLWRLKWVFWLVLFTGSSVAVADFAYTTWQTALLTRTHGVSAGEAGQYLGITALVAGTIGAWIGGVLSDRVGAKSGVQGRVALVLWCAPALLGSIALLLLPGKWAAVGAYLAWQLVAHVVYVAIAVTLQDIVTDRTRALAASMQTCLSIGLGLGFGPAVVAAMNESIGRGENALTVSLLLFVGIAAVVTLVFASLLRVSLKQQAAAKPVSISTKT